MLRVILTSLVGSIFVLGGVLGAYQAGVKGEWWGCVAFIGCVLLTFGGVVLLLRRELRVWRMRRRADALLRAANGGDAPTQCRLADLYSEIGMEKEAYGFYVAAARGGVAEAMYSVGYMLMPGMGAPCREDEEEGISWLIRAYEAGDARGASLLADLYTHGTDFTPADADLARLWRERDAAAACADEQKRQ